MQVNISLKIYTRRKAVLSLGSSTIDLYLRIKTPEKLVVLYFIYNFSTISITSIIESQISSQPGSQALTAIFFSER